jgi:ParB family transcriptional regulator, chromosome partitioning protein
VTDLVDSETYVADVALLDRLSAAKLEAEAETVRAEGWKWVEIMPDASYEALSGYRWQPGKRKPLPGKKQPTLDKLQAQRDALAEEYSDEDIAKVAALDEQIAAIEEASLTWSDWQKKHCGAIVSIGYDGSVEITRGLVAPQEGGKGGRGG